MNRLWHLLRFWVIWNTASLSQTTFLSCPKCSGDDCAPLKLRIGDTCGGACGSLGVCQDGLTCSTGKPNPFAVFGAPQLGTCVLDPEIPNSLGAPEEVAGHHQLQEVQSFSGVGEDAIPGGAYSIDVDDPDMLESINNGMRIYNQESGRSFSVPLLIESVASATEQVAAGLKYTAVMKVGSFDCSDQGGVPETDSRESYFSCYEGNSDCVLVDEPNEKWYEIEVWAHAPVNGQRAFDLMSMETTSAPNQLNLLEEEECLGCCPGCRIPMNVTSAWTMEVANAAVDLLANATDLAPCQLQLEKVLNATYQVVAGVKYVLEVAVVKYDPDDCAHAGISESLKFHLVLLFQSWRNPRYVLLGYNEIQSILLSQLVATPTQDTLKENPNGQPANLDTKTVEDGQQYFSDFSTNSTQFSQFGSTASVICVAAVAGILMLVTFGFAIYGGTPTNGHPVDGDGQPIAAELEMGGESLISYQQHQ